MMPPTKDVVTLTLEMPAKLTQQILQEAARQGKSPEQLVIETIEEYVNEYESAGMLSQ